MEDKDTKGLTGRSQGFNTIDIPGELESRTRRGVTVAAGTVYDYGWDNGNEESQGAFQEHINRTLKTKTESINNTINEVINPAVNKIPVLEDKINNNIPYTILYENQCINIPCDAYGNYTGDEDYIQTVVRLYHGNIIELLSEQDGITPITQITGIEVIKSSNREYATIAITRANINNLGDLTEFNFKLKGKSETIVNGKVIFNKVRQGKSSYQIWLDYKDENNQYPNAGKPVEAYLAYLRQSDFTTRGVLTKPADSDADTKTIYCIPNPEDENEWTEEIYDENIPGWITLATHAGGLTSILEHLESLRVDVSKFKAQINKINRDLDKKLDKQETDKAGLFLANSSGDVFMRYDNNGLDAEKVNQHFKELVKPDLSDYAKKKDIPEQVNVIKDTEEDGIYFTDDEGHVFLKYTNENGLDAQKVSEHLKGLIGASSGGGSDIKDVDESGAFFTGSNGKAFAKYNDEEGFDINKASNHLKNVVKDWNTPCVIGTSELMTESGNGIYLEVPDCKYNQTISFYGKVDDGTSLGTLVIRRGLSYSNGIGNDHLGSCEIHIDTTNVVVWGADHNHVETYPHGLNISRYVIVNINNSYRKATLQLITNDSTKPNGFTQSEIEFRGCRLGVKAFVEGANAELSDCSLSWSCSDLRKPVWAFGDSYFDYWTIPAIQIGYGNAMFDGHGGRGVGEINNQTYGGRKSFDLCLTFGNPKIVFWCLGANNPDTYAKNEQDYPIIVQNQETGKNEVSGLTINSAWKDATDHVIEECEKRGIELVLYTIHNGVGKDGNDKYTILRLGTKKNEYIKASGKRYIDVYDAMTDPDKDILTLYNDEGAHHDNEFDVDFYDGIGGNTDRVHPSTFGANVIARYIIAHLPELKDE